MPRSRSPAEDLLDLRFAREFGQHAVDCRMTPPEGTHQRREHEVRRARRKADAKASHLTVAHAPRGGREFRRCLQHLSCSRQQQFAGRREAHGAACARKERRAERALELLNALGERRLRDMQPLGRPRVVEVAGERHERGQQVQRGLGSHSV
jgi:hypothetical protein